MIEIDNFFCKIFLKIESEIIKKNILAKISQLLNQEWTFQYSHGIENNLLTVELRKNKEYHEQKSKDEIDGFLFYPYFLEIDLQKIDKVTAYITFIKELLDFLNKSHIQYVAACNFEDKLPKSI